MENAVNEQMGFPGGRAELTTVFKPWCPNERFSLIKRKNKKDVANSGAQSKNTGGNKLETLFVQWAVQKLHA